MSRWSRCAVCDYLRVTIYEKHKREAFFQSLPSLLNHSIRHVIAVGRANISVPNTQYLSPSDGRGVVPVPYLHRPTTWMLILKQQPLH